MKEKNTDRNEKKGHDQPPRLTRQEPSTHTEPKPSDKFAIDGVLWTKHLDFNWGFPRDWKEGNALDKSIVHVVGSVDVHEPALRTENAKQSAYEASSGALLQEASTLLPDDRIITVICYCAPVEHGDRDVGKWEDEIYDWTNRYRLGSGESVSSMDSFHEDDVVIRGCWDDIYTATPHIAFGTSNSFSSPQRPKISKAERMQRWARKLYSSSQDEPTATRGAPCLFGDEERQIDRAK